jgi:shikimate dehydrogenase
MIERKKTAVIGHPVEHSLSPAIHNFWINKGGINAAPYEKIDISPDNFNESLDKLINLGYYGLNVTVPLKELAFSKCDELTESAQKTKSTNTLIFKKGKIYGTNTDPVGFEFSLGKEIITSNINKKKCLVLGAGGSSRALVFALDKMSANISIFNRTPKRATKLCEDLNIKADLLEEKDLKKHTGSFDFIINTTSLGLAPEDKNNLIDFSLVHKKAFIYDLIYEPKESSFLKQAKAQNLNFQNGLKMLVGQAAAAFYVWHDKNPSHINELESFLGKL